MHENNYEELQKHIEQQKQAIQKLNSQESKISQYVLQFKAALQRKKQKQKTDAIKKSQQTQEKLENQLLKEIQTAKTILKNYQHQFKNIKKKTKNTSTQDDLLKIQEEIQQKTTQIKSTEQEIKDLKLLKKKLQKVIQTKQKNQGSQTNKLSKLTQQVKRQKQLLESFKTKNIKKEEAIQKKKTQIIQIQSQYHQQIKKIGQKPLLFEDFKEKRKQKRKQQMSSSKHKQKQQKKIITVKEMINNQYQSYGMQPTQKNLEELKIKKQIATNSLKLAQKKHEKEIQQSKARLERLKQQSEMLQGRISDKIKQKQQIQNVKYENGDNSQQISNYDQFKKNKRSPQNLSLMKNRISGSHTALKLEPINK